jgi:aquaporin TIP
MVDSPSRIALAEAIGTFTLVFAGVLAINAGTLAGDPELSSLTTVALAHGLAIFVMVAALSAISGGHFNPAITLGFVVSGRLPLRRAALYWIAQLVGAVVAALIIAGAFGRQPVAEGTPALAPNVTALAGIVLELIGTFFLVLVVLGTAVDRRAPAAVFPLAIGLTIAMNIMAFGTLTGGSVNPARAFGPALISGAWADHLVYWIGPLLGGAIAGLVMEHGIGVRAEAPEVRERGGPAPGERRAAA